MSDSDKTPNVKSEPQASWAVRNAPTIIGLTIIGLIIGLGFFMRFIE